MGECGREERLSVCLALPWRAFACRSLNLTRPHSCTLSHPTAREQLQRIHTGFSAIECDNSDGQRSQPQSQMESDDERKEGDQPEQQQQQQHSSEGMEIEQQGEEAEQQQGADSGETSVTLKRPLSAYFLFAQHIRPTLLAELESSEGGESAAPANGKNKLAVVGKLVGERWKTMSDEEKEVISAQTSQAARARRWPSMAPSAAAS